MGLDIERIAFGCIVGVAGAAVAAGTGRERNQQINLANFRVSEKLRAAGLSEHVVHHLTVLTELHKMLCFEADTVEARPSNRRPDVRAVI